MRAHSKFITGALMTSYSTKNPTLGQRFWNSSKFKFLYFFLRVAHLQKNGRNKEKNNLSSARKINESPQMLKMVLILLLHNIKKSPSS
jgi:hypothetical protein